MTIITHTAFRLRPRLKSTVGQLDVIFKKHALMDWDAQSIGDSEDAAWRMDNRICSNFEGSLNKNLNLMKLVNQNLRFQLKVGSFALWVFKSHYWLTSRCCTAQASLIDDLPFYLICGFPSGMMYYRVLELGKKHPSFRKKHPSFVLKYTHFAR